MLKDRTALMIQCVIRRKKIQICPPLKIFIYLFIACVSIILPARMYMHNVLQCPRRPEEGIGPLVLKVQMAVSDHVNSGN